MRFVFYSHSIVSDWNHGNAHFLRGVVRELMDLGHDVVTLEPLDSWSRQNLVADQGEAAEARFFTDFRGMRTVRYGAGFDHEAALDGADVVVVHEWSDPALVAEIGRLRRGGARFLLFFHDTHHRAVSAEADIRQLALCDYDGILAFGETLRERYVRAGWGRRAFTWHEAADTALFRPIEAEKTGDLVWVGNWGDGERSEELETFLIRPSVEAGLDTTIHGVRYPNEALLRLRQAGIAFGGWIANAAVPETFARHRLTVHVPRRPYVAALPGIPTIRMFEALACDIPLICAPWDDVEGLFRGGQDYLSASDGEAMRRLMARVVADRDLARDLAASGLDTIRRRHTCRHRVSELFAIMEALGGPLHRVRPAEAAA